MATGTIPLEQLFVDSPSSADGEPKQRRTRQPRSTPTLPGIDKATFKEMFELASAGLSLAGAKDYALSADEIDKMADAWYRLAKEYPSFGKHVTKGRKLSVWGNLLFVNLIVVGKRVDMAANWWQTRPVRLRQAPPQARPQARPQVVRPTVVHPESTGERQPLLAPSEPDYGT